MKAKGPVRIEDPDFLPGHRAIAAVVAADGEPHGQILALMPMGARAIAEELWFAGELGLRLAQVLELSGAPPAESDESPPAPAAAAGLRRALDAGELRMLFEPIASIESGEIAAAEVVIEIPGRDVGTLRPGALGDGGADEELERTVFAWAREEACRVAAELELRGLGVMVGLDVSAADLASPALAAALARDARAAGASPSSLLLEVSGDAVRAAGAGDAIAVLREHGFLIAIDDFGAGSAMPVDLLEFSVDVLKISPGLVAGATHDAPRAERLSAVAELARDLGLDVVAQGVGDPEQPLVAELGCRWAQGAAIGRPRRLGELIERVGPQI